MDRPTETNHLNAGEGQDSPTEHPTEGPSQDAPQEAPQSEQQTSHRVQGTPQHTFHPPPLGIVSFPALGISQNAPQISHQGLHGTPQGPSLSHTAQIKDVVASNPQPPVRRRRSPLRILPNILEERERLRSKPFSPSEREKEYSYLMEEVRKIDPRVHRDLIGSLIAFGEAANQECRRLIQSSHGHNDQAGPPGSAPTGKPTLACSQKLRINLHCYFLQSIQWVHKLWDFHNRSDSTSRVWPDMAQILPDQARVLNKHSHIREDMAKINLPQTSNRLKRTHRAQIIQTKLLQILMKIMGAHKLMPEANLSQISHKPIQIHEHMHQYLQGCQEARRTMHPLNNLNSTTLISKCEACLRVTIICFQPKEMVTLLHEISAIQLFTTIGLQTHFILSDFILTILSTTIDPLNKVFIKLLQRLLSNHHL
ncbi:hypothetical protein TWF192_005457 [Orbilia oligospora]|nr:hypothetical protein TWF192_005457 [Orbilia oligospora]